MADSDSIDNTASKEKQDVDTFVDNTCYEKIPCKQSSDGAWVRAVLTTSRKCVFGRRTGQPDGEDCWQTHPYCHLVL